MKTMEGNRTESVQSEGKERSGEGRVWSRGGNEERKTMERKKTGMSTKERRGEEKRRRRKQGLGEERRAGEESRD